MTFDEVFRTSDVSINSIIQFVFHGIVICFMDKAVILFKLFTLVSTCPFFVELWYAKF